MRPLVFELLLALKVCQLLLPRYPIAWRDSFQLKVDAESESPLCLKLSCKTSFDTLCVTDRRRTYWSDCKAALQMCYEPSEPTISAAKKPCKTLFQRLVEPCSGNPEGVVKQGNIRVGTNVSNFFRDLKTL